MMTQGNARQMMLDLGAPPFLASASIPMMWWLPGATDPDSQGVMEIIKGLQRGLSKLGFPVIVSGVLDPGTTAALDQLSPPKGSWASTTWIVLMQRVLHALRTGKKFVSVGALSGLGSYPPYGYGPIPGRAAGLPPGPLGMGDFVMRSGIAKPKDKTTLGVFQGLQRAINVGLSKMGKPTIKDDGDIGPATLAAARTVGATIGSPQCTSVTACIEMLANGAQAFAIGIASRFGAAVNSAPDVAKAPVGSSSLPPGLPTGDQAGMFGFLKNVPGGKYLPYVALGLGAMFLAVKMREGYLWQKQQPKKA